jgi:hypothetical protein
MLLVGLLVMPVGVVGFGLAIRRDPAFGPVVGTVSVGLVAATVMLVDPQLALAAVSVLALIVFHLIAGWKTYRLSRLRVI